MAFSREDADLVKAEYDADPERWQSYASTAGLRREYHQFHPECPDNQPGSPSYVPPSQAEAAGREGSADPARHPTEEVEEAEQQEPPRRHSRTSSISTVSQEELNTRAAARRRNQRLDSLATVSTNQLEEKLMSYLDRHPTAIQRIEEHRLQHTMTVGSRRTPGRGDLPSFGGGKPYPPPLPEREEYVVEFDGHDDPRHAQNWPMRKKLTIASILILDALAATFASSIFSAASTAVGMHFGKGREVVTLGTSLFVLGYALGPIVFAPLSELYGRRIPVIIGAFAFGIFNIGVATAKDFQTVMICRFFAGVMGAAPLTIVAAVFADMFNNEQRGVAVAVFSATIFNGPLMAPFVGGFITKSYLGWRWTAYIPSFMGFAACVLSLFFQDETYGPVILVGKASELRRLTRNWGIHAKQEEVEVDFKELAIKNLSRPLRILFTEPIVLIITIYMSFIYGILYLNLTAYGIVFGQIYGFSLGVSGLPYFGMIIGVFFGLIAVVFSNPSYIKKLSNNNGVPVPEWRLPLAMVGGILFSAGLFWFGWGGYKTSTPWIVPTLAGLFLGFGIYCVFLQCLNYIIDAYLMFAASAIAANTFMRSIFGAIFPLFATYMFEGIGINWGMTLLGCVAALFIPAPFLLYTKGKAIRAKSKFAPALDIQQDQKRDEEARMGGDGSSGEGEGEGDAEGAKTGMGGSKGGSRSESGNGKDKERTD